MRRIFGVERVFKKILIANRGEVAIRIIRACRELGIKCASVYSEADKYSLHVKLADEAYYLGPSEPRASYLNMEKIIEIATKIGADAIHPGYGFLSENAEFARMCDKNGIVFIGPSPEVISLTGDKLQAKVMAKRADVPVIPGSLTPIEKLSKALDLVEEIGFPVLLKPADGGGGIGMKIARNKLELEKLFPIAQQEAYNAFGSKRLIIERVIENAKHIEMQIIADKYGNKIWLGERDCSIQRRYQKLIEETPSPVISKDKREELGELALKFINSVGYDSVGTVEFLYSGGNFYFLEVNARLQVEHGITEIVTGVDLVKEQILLASGEELSYKQDDISIRGWAIEARIIAEDPSRGFAPSPGKITFYDEPGGIGVRVDSYVYEGFEVPPYYDPLIAKLIVWGNSRLEAIQRLKRSVSEYFIGGIKTNIPIIQRIVNEREFIDGSYTTSFLTEKLPRFQEELREEELRIASVIAALLVSEKINHETVSNKVKADKHRKIISALYSRSINAGVMNSVIQVTRWGRRLSSWRRAAYNFSH